MTNVNTGAPVSIPHLRIPFTIGSTGSAQTVQQDSATEIVQSVANLVGTRPGTRYMVPTYGMPDPTFGGVKPGALALAVKKWEPRATVSTQVTPGNEEQVTVQVSVAAGAPS